MQAITLEQIGDREEALHLYERARSIVADDLQRNDEDARLHSAHGLALAGLGRTEEALGSSRRALDLLPVHEDALAGQTLLMDYAFTLLRAGRHTEAIEALGQYLSTPSVFSIEILQLDPRLDRVRENLALRALVEREHARRSR